jgi:hypothetical protein
LNFKTDFQNIFFQNTLKNHNANTKIHSESKSDMTKQDTPQTRMNTEDQALINTVDDSSGEIHFKQRKSSNDINNLLEE